MKYYQRRPFLDKNKFYAYVWRHRGEVIWVGFGHYLRGIPSKGNYTGRPEGLKRLLEEYWEEISYEVIGCDSKEEAQKLEVQLTEKLRPKFNQVLGFAGFTGKKHTEESKKLISQASTGRPLSELGRKKASERAKLRNTTNPPRKGKKCSEEHKRKVSEARKRWWERKRAENKE